VRERPGWVVFAALKRLPSLRSLAPIRVGAAAAGTRLARADSSSSCWR